MKECVKAILGLGNPGREYERSRHNLGYMVIDNILLAHNARLRAGNGEFLYAKIDIDGKQIFLLRSTTYMNYSGIGAYDACECLDINPDELLVVLDDFALEFGNLRIRRSGSDGGHKGLASVIYHLGTENIPRLRIGIGPLPEGVDAVDFVLGEFNDKELKALPKIIEKASDAAIMCAINGIQRAMEVYNRRSKPNGIKSEER